jgi:hypothetical protein
MQIHTAIHIGKQLNVRSPAFPHTRLSVNSPYVHNQLLMLCMTTAKTSRTACSNYTNICTNYFFITYTRLHVSTHM